MMASIPEVITNGNGLDFSLRRVVNNEERRSLIDLVQVLDQAPPMGDDDDELQCNFTVGNHFSAKECYLNLLTVVSSAWEG
ncbi:hypothetical protein BVC80_8879g24 [Macleaya cordata]|uniref:Uncharacterized protein n=1 Tax=Macleaya cordata TaxID=56857 RepID=A0A200QK41_MACCD|nr:hypothetical protein BVC80_8879g24 [Macleaya cordata]